MKTSHEILWSATTEDEPPTEFFLVDDAPDGLSLIVSEGDTELGVTLGDIDVQQVIATMVAFRARQERKLVVTSHEVVEVSEVDADDSHGQ